MKRKKFGKGLAILLLILLIPFMGYLLYTKFYGGTKEDKIEKKLLKMGTMFYEEYYYDALVEQKGSEDNAISYLSQFADKGLKISFDNLKTYFDKNSLMNYTELMDCDVDKTRAVIYPKAPYGKKDYDIKAELSCDLIKATADSKKFKQEYEELNGDDGKLKVSIDEKNQIIYSSLEEINKKIKNSDSFVIFLGSPYFNESRVSISTFLDVSKDYNIKEIYYVDIIPDGKEENDIRTTYGLNENNEVYKVREGSSEYNTFIAYAKDILPNPNEDFIKGTDYEGEKTILNSAYIYVENGVPISYTDGRPSEVQDYKLVTTERLTEIFKEFYGKKKAN